MAFDKVWHPGLLYKLRKSLPYAYFRVLQSYITDRFFQVKVKDDTSNLRRIISGVPQGSVLGPVLYLLYTADLPTCPNTVVATFADDTAILASDKNLDTATAKLQTNLDSLQQWANKWKMKISETKSQHITFTLKHGTCPPVTFNDTPLPQVDDVKYLGMHLDKRLTWGKHIKTKRKHLTLKFNRLYWLLGRQSRLSVENKLLIYKVMLRPVWTYGVQLWGTASNSNIEILQRFQSKTLRTILSAPWYVSNAVIHKDLHMKTVKETISEHTNRYLLRLDSHPNPLALNLLDNSEAIYRLQRYDVLALPTRFHN